MLDENDKDDDENDEDDGCWLKMIKMMMGMVKMMDVG